MDDACPGCGHSLSKEHDYGDGCMNGWTYPEGGGAALTEGCTCILTIARNQ
jgi:hypothetical protein